MRPATTQPERRGRPRATDPSIAVALVRVSTEEQVNGPGAQRDAIERYAAAQGLQVARWFEELGVSGGAALERRAGLWDAVATAKRLRAGVFIVAKLDRLARDQVAALLLERELEAAGIRLVTADGAGNGDGPEAKLLRSMLSAIAEYERSIIAARTRAALQARKRRGLRGPGSLPYGRRLGADGVTLEDEPTEAAIVARVRAERAGGRTLTAIAAGLEADGIQPRGRRWHPTTIARLAAGG